MIKHKEALLRDLERLRDELPGMITAIRADDQRISQEAVALVTGASRERFRLAEKRLIEYVISEHRRGNSTPLNHLASGSEL